MLLYIMVYYHSIDMTAKNVHITKLDIEPMDRREIEFVERKGHGHPDFIADSIAEAVSRELSIYYKEEFGAILHHNVDKVLVVGGQVDRWFGGGVVIHPIYILVAGRATVEVKTDGGIKKVPIGSIVQRAAKNWLRRTFREYLNVEEHVVIDYRIGQGSLELVETLKGRGKHPDANDTSIGVGYAPLSETERLVKLVEEKLYQERLRTRAIGEDIKVMAYRKGDVINLTVAVAIISSEVHSMEDYEDKKEKIKEFVLKVAEGVTRREVFVNVNTADKAELGDKGLYLVVTGTSAEHGDDGATGRGNRVNGLITPLRPMSLEATAGKNPVSHVGKLYNVAARRAAEKIVALDGVEEAYVEILSSIGKPINEPQIAHVGLVVSDNNSFSQIKKESEAIVYEVLDAIKDLQDEFIGPNPPEIF